MGIVKGFTNLALGNNVVVSNRRLAICAGCSTRKPNSKWCKPPNEGGCGCYLPAKTKDLGQVCPKGKW